MNMFECKYHRKKSEKRYQMSYSSLNKNWKSIRVKLNNIQYIEYTTTVKIINYVQKIAFYSKFNRNFSYNF